MHNKSFTFVYMYVLTNWPMKYLLDLIKTHRIWEYVTSSIL